MAQGQRGNTVRAIDWRESFPFTEVFRGFRIATQPGKLLAALLLVVLMFVLGWVLDGLVGARRVLPGEFAMYCQSRTAEQFREKRDAATEDIRQDLAWEILRGAGGLSYEQATEIADRADRWAAAAEAIGENVDDPAQRAALMDELRKLQPDGVFATALEIKVQAFGDLIGSAWIAVSELNWKKLGLSQVDPRQPLEPHTVVGAIRTVAIALPGWLWATQPWFLVIWLAVFIGLWSLLGGTLARMATVEAATGDRVGVGEGLRFAFKRWPGFVLAPLLPLVMFGLVALALMVGGLLFHVPGLDILAGLFWIVAILAGVVIAVGVIAWAGAVNLMYPGLAAEGTDVFDSISRSYSYVVTRPWKFLWYTLVALVYGTITYAFVGLVIYLTTYLARQATAVWSEPFAAMLPMPEFGDLRHGLPDAEVGGTDLVASVVVRVWFMLVVSLIAAYAISFYFAAFALVYLLLRRDCDGTDMSQVEVGGTGPDGGGVAPAAAPSSDKVEPADDQ